MSEEKAKKERLTRREFLRSVCHAGGLFMVGGALGASMPAGERETIWQIDPDKCVECGQCATHCVLEESAVKCVHDYVVCGYCERCTGFFVPTTNDLTEGAENELCPTGAIEREFIEEPYFEYRIDEPLCIGCAICVRNCRDFGNGSLYLQVRHDRCLQCNECNIAAHCPSDAFMRIPANAKPYVIKSQWGDRV